LLDLLLEIRNARFDSARFRYTSSLFTFTFSRNKNLTSSTQVELHYVNKEKDIFLLFLMS